MFRRSHPRVWNVSRSGPSAVCCPRRRPKPFWLAFPTNLRHSFPAGMLLHLIIRCLLQFRGRDEFSKRLGTVADYCSVCRKIGPFDVLAKRVAEHVLFVPTERGHSSGATRVCGSCRTESRCSVGQYAAFEKSASVPLEALIESTFPTVRETYREELAVADQIAAGGYGLDQALRKRLLKQAFALAEPHFRVGRGQQGRRILSVALRPLRPTEDEVRACLQPYRNTSSRMGARLTTQEALTTIYPELEVKDPDKYSY